MFAIQQRGGSVAREIIGGVTTFLAMSYIIFVQFGLLTQHAGMDGGGVIMATCIAAGTASILMGLLANYPVALAPGMGENFFFAFTLVPAMAALGIEGTQGWQMAMAMVLLSGVLFLLLSFVGFRSYVLNAIPASLKHGIAAGIGLLIATVGMSYGNLIHAGGGLVEFVGFTVRQGDQVVLNYAALLTLIGVAVLMILTAFRIPGAVLLTILILALLALDYGGRGLGLIHWPDQGPTAMPTGLGKTAGGSFAGVHGLWQAMTGGKAVEILTFVFVLLFMDLFDTVGTLVGVTSRSGLLREDGTLPNAERALAADAAGTVIGAGLGTTTVTSYIESVTGVSAGARSGLAAIVTGLLFFAAMFFHPIVAMIGGGVEVAPGVYKYPLIAPALILVGAMMLRSVAELDWSDPTEYLPAFLAILAMPLTMSISTGIAVGFVTYALGKLLTGRPKQCPIMVYVVSVLFVLRYILSPAG